MFLYPIQKQRRNLLSSVLAFFTAVSFLSSQFHLSDAASDDPIVVGQTFLAGSIDPIEGSAPWALTSHGIAEKLFTVDKHGEIVGQVGASVRKVDEIDSLVWEVSIKPGYKFSDGTPVTAEHVVDCLTDLNENNSNAQSSLGSISVSAVDDLTVKIKTERPTHVMDAVLAEWVFVIYYRDADKIVFTGPYSIESFGDDKIELVPNPHYDSRSLDRSLVTLQKFADGHDLAKAFKNNEVDIGFHLPIDTLPELRKAEGVRVKSFEVGYQYMMFHNMDSTLQDLNVRKAIDIAIDRTALSQALSDEAKALLDEAGWVANPTTGKREKNGEELNINLVAYPHRPGLVIMQPVIEESLTGLGFTVNSILTGDDWDETATIINERTFDLLMWAQHTLPAGDPQWFLSAFFHSDGSNNHANLSSDTVDSMLDTLSLAEYHQERIRLTKSTHGAILSEVPVSNLVTPYWHVGLSDRMADYEPWGSDYYVIRSDLFPKETETDAEPSADSSEAMSSLGNRNSLGNTGVLVSLLVMFFSLGLAVA